MGALREVHVSKWQNKKYNVTELPEIQLKTFSPIS
jgi:hypothetical protein